MARSLPPTRSKAMDQTMDPSVEQVKQFYLNLAGDVMGSVAQDFLDEGIGKEIWCKLLRAWQSKLGNALDEVVQQRQRPAVIEEEEEEEMTPVELEVSIPQRDSLRVTIRVPVASIYDGKLQEVLALPEMKDILKDSWNGYLSCTLESKVHQAIRSLTAGAALYPRPRPNGTANTDNEPSSASMQRDPLDLSVAEPRHGSHSDF